MSQLRILDLACAEGVYAIEAALRGAQVIGIDARTARMHDGQKITERLGLGNLRFEQADIREVDVASHGQFDVIYALGILYHLDIDENYAVLRNMHAMCRQFMVIDTVVAEEGAPLVQCKNGAYEGKRVREHEDDDPASVRLARVGRSIDSTFAFQFTKASLCRCLRDVGFTSVFECRVPLEPTKPIFRVTVVAIKGEQEKISTYPWINNMTECEISSFLRAYDEKIQKRI